MTNKKVIFQPDAMDCGPTCLAMVAGHYGRHPDRDMLRELCDLGKEGVSPLTSSRWCLKKMNTNLMNLKINPKCKSFRFDRLILKYNSYVCYKSIDTKLMGRLGNTDNNKKNRNNSLSYD